MFDKPTAYFDRHHAIMIISIINIALTLIKTFK
jgi:hypothetical protein